MKLETLYLPKKNVGTTLSNAKETDFQTKINNNIVIIITITIIIIIIIIIIPGPTRFTN
jgi:magnesium-transporting ATPase (P-type)